jgi:soluble lytic murein transglycosylase
MEKVAAEGAATYYGFLARTRLQEEAPESYQAVMDRLRSPPKVGEVWPLDAGPMAADPHFRGGVELIRLENREGASELLAVARKGQGEESIRLLFHILRATGHEKQAAKVARPFLREGLSGTSLVEARMLYEAAYPNAFRAMVEKHSKKANVDPDLMQALIREESAFNPRARSSTGALGLAQLMPATASQVARSLKVRRVTTRSLLNPGQNIRLGSKYLGDLHRKFEGNTAYAVASYNAGPFAVNRWLKKYPEAELDEWVEQIPIDETRNYVKRVLGSYGTYQILSLSSATEGSGTNAGGR